MFFGYNKIFHKKHLGILYAEVFVLYYIKLWLIEFYNKAYNFWSKYAFIIDDVLEEIAMYTVDNGDLRTGINLLRNCGNIAEANASREITMDHFNQAVDSLVSINVVQILDSLTDIERSLLELIVDSKENITAGELGEAFREKEMVSYASFNRTLDKLEFVRLIDTKYTGSGVRGNSREIILRFDPDDFDI